jgi:hypothetical protein
MQLRRRAADRDESVNPKFNPKANLGLVPTRSQDQIGINPKPGLPRNPGFGFLGWKRSQRDFGIKLGSRRVSPLVGVPNTRAPGLRRCCAIWDGSERRFCGCWVSTFGITRFLWMLTRGKTTADGNDKRVNQKLFHGCTAFVMWLVSVRHSNDPADRRMILRCLDHEVGYVCTRDVKPKYGQIPIPHAIPSRVGLVCEFRRPHHRPVKSAFRKDALHG